VRGHVRRDGRLISGLSLPPFGAVLDGCASLRLAIPTHSAQEWLRLGSPTLFSLAGSRPAGSPSTLGNLSVCACKRLCCVIAQMLPSPDPF
jgi:hypothetical protein